MTKNRQKDKKLNKKRIANVIVIAFQSLFKRKKFTPIKKILYKEDCFYLYPYSQQRFNLKLNTDDFSISTKHQVYNIVSIYWQKFIDDPQGVIKVHITEDELVDADLPITIVQIEDELITFQQVIKLS
jgi:hypothetical protein